MASQIDKTLVSNLDDNSTSKVLSKEPALKFNMTEFLEMKRLKTAGDIVGVEDLEKKVRQRMESEATGPIETAKTSIDCKKSVISKQVKSTTALLTSSTGGNLSVKNVKNVAVNQKRPESTVSTSNKNVNMVSNEDKKAVFKKEKSMTTMTSKSTSGNLTINKEKYGVNKEKPKSIASLSKEKQPATSSMSISKGIRGNFPNNKGKQAVYLEKSTSLTSSSNLSINNGKGSAVNKEKTKTTVSSNSVVAIKSIPKLETCIERWKSLREKGGKYRPLECFLPPDILNNKNQVVIVDQIAKEFELARLRRLLEQDKLKPNGKRLAQERIEHLNNYGKNYTRLEIAAVRNEIGPKKDQRIRSHIVFLNEKNIIKHKVITKLSVIENPDYLKKGVEQFQEEQSKQNKGKFLQREKQEDLERKRKFERTWEQRQEKLSEEKRRKEKLAEERKRVSQQGRKREGLEGKLTEQRRRQERMAEIKRHQEKFLKAPTEAEVQRRRNRVIEDLRPKHINSSKKIMTNRNEASTSTSLKKRTFDERSEVASSSRAQKRRNVEDGELDICRLDEATVNRNLSTIIHSLVRPGRRPIYGIVDDNDDDAMEVSGNEIFREEARSSRLARKEDEEEERAEQQRRNKKLRSKKR